jgi:hypothetical protein
MDAQTDGRRRWPRIVLTLPPDVAEGLRELADTHYRDGKREALRLLTEGVERELAAARSNR